MESIPLRQIETPPREPNFATGFNIRSLTDLLDGNDMIQELHRHDFYYVLALERGSGSHDIDFASYPVADHTVFVMRPRQVHQLTLHAGSSGYLVGFKTEFLADHTARSMQLLRKAACINYYPVGAERFSGIGTTLSRIHSEYFTKAAGYFDVIKASLSILFVELARHVESAGATAEVSYNQKRLDEFQSLLEANIATHKQVSEYAGMLNLTPYQLNAITRSLLGKTSSEVINEYILLESKRFLLGTANQVNQVAYTLGYEDPSYFIRFFRKHTGFSPEAFRRNFK